VARGPIRVVPILLACFWMLFATIFAVVLFKLEQNSSASQILLPESIMRVMRYLCF
jgi:hypothetical protein